jgi:hypothetical protein
MIPNRPFEIKLESVQKSHFTQHANRRSNRSTLSHSRVCVRGKVTRRGFIARDCRMVRLFVWLVTAVVIFLLLSFASMLTKTYDWRLWLAIRRARREIGAIARRRIRKASVFSHQGATAIDPAYLAFFVKTATDKDRDLLCQDPEICLGRKSKSWTAICANIL